MPRLKPPSKEESLLLPAFAALPDSAIHLPATEAEFAAARTALLAQSALGFDTESKPIFSTQQVDTGPHLVQLATTDAAWLLQLHHPQALELARELLAHPGICKVGFGLDNDKATLPRRLGCELHNVVDLDRVFKQYGYGNSTGVRAAVALVLGQNFHKSKKMSTSNWAARQYSPGQLRYAANDAHGPAVVHAALPAWQSRQPAPAAARPPRPPRAPRAPGSDPIHSVSPAPTPQPSSGLQPAALAPPSGTQGPQSMQGAAPVRSRIAALFQPRRG
ncbi:3'-5' exonuclease [Comamonas terrigena]|uniref:3'-5' exonuclease n=1 Tax=Comamonas terrigena TaxID=32013 RepID=UPI00244BC18C|nr:3'-5' exonuclease domain-containing protein 2 [Comamonas terrigena]MDH0050203.1 3'-5' exonuclease domain-containing protein 2 [Comamonas terrigena]MDH0512565.1 3'-5' exonuclease domain-containing protein 2 [Comamonas terrigena]MDH1092071.1 3'-5' exonuclease domain-containing protein 2 [Comamonas terrigena]MDH1501184.1 3'-5' exonuclease domain-containing protein 2 [Comamonas terrigena]